MAFKITALIIAATTIHVAIGAAKADESVLYGDAPPRDAVFVRLLGESHNGKFEINGHELKQPDGAQAAYLAISAAALGLTETGTFHSLLTDAKGQQVAVKEPSERTNAKVHLFLINADETPARLVVPNRDVEVIAQTGRMEIGTRSVNPIRTPLAVQRGDDGEVIGSFDVSLSRGQNITFLVQQGQVTIIENRFGPVIEPTG